MPRKEVIQMTTLDLFSETNVSVAEPEPMTLVRVGTRVAQIPLRKKRREALTRLMEILAELEGKDIHIGSYDAGGRHFRLGNLKLPRLQLEFHPYRFKGDNDYIPSAIVLWGSRSAQLRIFPVGIFSKPNITAAPLGHNLQDTEDCDNSPLHLNRLFR